MEFLKCIKSRAAIACCWSRQPGFLKMAGVMKKSAPKRKTKKRRHRHGWDETGKERERDAGA